MTSFLTSKWCHVEPRLYLPFLHSSTRKSIISMKEYVGEKEKFRFLPTSTYGAPGIENPIIVSSGSRIITSCQSEGIRFTSRWGSPQSMGIPLSVSFPETAQLLLPINLGILDNHSTAPGTRGGASLTFFNSSRSIFSVRYGNSSFNLFSSIPFWTICTISFSMLPWTSVNPKYEKTFASIIVSSISQASGIYLRSLSSKTTPPSSR